MSELGACLVWVLVAGRCRSSSSSAPTSTQVPGRARGGRTVGLRPGAWICWSEGDPVMIWVINGLNAVPGVLPPSIAAASCAGGVTDR